MRPRLGTIGRHRRGGGRAAGFTLLELLVVLVIAVAIAGVALPRFAGVMETVELKRAARELASALREARSQAIAQRRDVALVLDVERRMFETNGGRRPRALPPRLDLRLVAAESEVVSEAVGAIRFFTDGSSTGGRITVSAGSRAYVIDVNWLTGRVVIHD